MTFLQWYNHIAIVLRVDVAKLLSQFAVVVERRVIRLGVEHIYSKDKLQYTID